MRLTSRSSWGTGPLVAVVALLAGTPSASGYAELVKTWGSTGSGEGQFHSPAGLATDSKGNVYVADTGNDRIQKFDPSGSSITEWGTSGAGDGQFSGPMDVALSPSGRVYVADTGNDRIQEFSRSGVFLGKWGTPGSGPFQFSSPSSVATNASGTVFVADTGNDRIQVFTATGSGLVTEWGGSGSGDGQFDGPSGVGTDLALNVYVTDTGNDRVEKFRPLGTFLGKWGVPGSGNGFFHSPMGIAADSVGNVYVADTGNGWIQKFDSSGAALFAFDFGFGHPSDVATAFPSRVYVTGNDRILKLNDGVTIGVSSRSGSAIEVTSTAGTKDNLRITRPSHSILRVTDLPKGPYSGSGVNAGTGCRKKGPYTVDCRASRIIRLQVAPRDERDRVVNLTGLRSSISGGTGNDTLIGGSNRDRLRANSGDVLKGMGGNDLLMAYDHVSDPLINCDGRGVRGHDDKAFVDELPLDPDSVIKHCESVRR